MKTLGKESGLVQEQNKTRFPGQGRQQEVSSGPCYYSACVVFLSFIVGINIGEDVKSGCIS